MSVSIDDLGPDDKFICLACNDNFRLPSLFEETKSNHFFKVYMIDNTNLMLLLCYQWNRLDKGSPRMSTRVPKMTAMMRSFLKQIGNGSAHLST